MSTEETNGVVHYELPTYSSILAQPFETVTNYENGGH